MTIKEFIDECNKLVKTMDIKPSEDSDSVRKRALYNLRKHFEDIGINIIIQSCTDFEISKKYPIQISTGESVDVEISIHFKTTVKRTGNIIQLTNTKSKYEVTVADKFVKVDSIKILYWIPRFSMYDDKKITTNGFHTPYNTYIPKAKVDKNQTFDDILATVDIPTIEDKYHVAISLALVPKVLYDEALKKELRDYMDDQGEIVDWKGLESYVRKNYTIVI